MARWSSLLNVVLPGSGLLIGGRIGWGLTLLLPTILLIAVDAAGFALLAGPFGQRVLLISGSLHVVLAMVAVGLDWYFLRRSRIDPQRVRALHREACRCWLQARTPEALAQALFAARTVVEAAPEESGAWRFLARVAGDAGDSALARRAESRADAIDLR